MKRRGVLSLCGGLFLAGCGSVGEPRDVTPDPERSPLNLVPGPPSDEWTIDDQTIYRNTAAGMEAGTGFQYAAPSGRAYTVILVRFGTSDEATGFIQQDADQLYAIDGMFVFLCYRGTLNSGPKPITTDTEVSEARQLLIEIETVTDGEIQQTFKLS